MCTKALGAQSRGFFVDQLNTGADQLIAHAVFDAARRRLFCAVTGVGDTRFSHRVSQQKFWRLGVEAILAHQAFEHGRHRARVVSGLFQVEDADTVGFLLVLAREGTLRLNGCGLSTGDGRDPGITATGGGNHDPGEQRRHHRHLHPLRSFYTAREVAL